MSEPMYRPYVAAGETVFLSGQVGLLPDGSTITGGAEAQAVQALNNMRTVLESAGLTMADVVKVNVFLESMDDYDAMNAAYVQAFPEAAKRPARSAMAVHQLPRDFLVEIEGVAYRNVTDS